MKRLLLIVLPLLLIVGCEDEKATEEEVNPLVGVWDMTSASILVQSNPSTTITITKDADNFETMILGEDGIYSYSGKINGEPESGSGSWSSTANKLTIIEDGETTIIDFSISGSTLTTTVSEAETDTNWGSVITIIYDKTS